MPAIVVTRSPAVSRVLSGAYTGPYGAPLVAPAVRYRIEFITTGPGVLLGSIDGYTAVKGTPNAPLRARVRLIRERDGRLVRETFSYPTTGYYLFSGLPAQESYTVLTYHPAQEYRAVAADGLIPEVSS